MVPDDSTDTPAIRTHTLLKPTLPRFLVWPGHGPLGVLAAVRLSRRATRLWELLLWGGVRVFHSPSCSLKVSPAISGTGDMGK